MEEIKKEKLSKKYTRKEILEKFIDVDEKLGKLTFMDYSVAMMPATILSDIYKELRSITGKAARGLIVRAAKISGRRQGEKFKNSDNPILAALNILTIWSALGWGRAKLERDGKIIRFIFDYTFDGRNYYELHGKTEEPMCWITFGFAWGLFEGIFDKEIFGEEKECVAKGDEKCVFEFEVVE